jgi:DNA modification methylase
MAWTSFDKPAKKFVKTNDLNKEHPTQKPKELFKWCLENYSQP